MIGSVLTKVFGSKNDRMIKEMQQVVVKINDLEPQVQELDDVQLAAKTVEFKERVAKGESLDDLLVEAFAVVREAGLRVLGERHYDVQLIGGITLHRGASVRRARRLCRGRGSNRARNIGRRQ